MASKNKVRIGAYLIGGGETVRIQSMLNTDTRDVKACLRQIEDLALAGCEIVRLSVPDEEAAEALYGIIPYSRVPLVADIHFDYRLALKSIDAGIHKLRINPGNIGSRANVEKLVSACKAREIPIRIGVNSGSLERELLQKYGAPTADALAESALRHVSILEELGFYDIVVSVKSSSSLESVKANRLLASKIPYPLHLGVTEAGLGMPSHVKAALGIGSLLMEGIGDTIRVSITGDPLDEIPVAKEILSSATGRRFGVNIISCPTCARCKIDLKSIVLDVMELTKDIKKELDIAIMGCQVNGPGEARGADIAICGAPKDCLLFVKGELKARYSYDEIKQALIDEVRKQI